MAVILASTICILDFFACFLSSAEMFSIINLLKKPLTHHSKPVNLISSIFLHNVGIRDIK